MSELDSTRLEALAAADPTARDLAGRLLGIAVRGLPAMYRPETGEFAHSRIGVSHLRGKSPRYGAMVALGARFLSEADQRVALSGQTSYEFTGTLVDRLHANSDLGDAAVVCWAAAEHRHPGLPAALAKLGVIDAGASSRTVVETSWIVSALAAARDQADVEAHLKQSRDRLLGARRPGAVLFPRAADSGTTSWYRAHVGCFADQVYPIQALARLHASGSDEQALAAADACAARICELQGEGGQWWWHYDARTGDLVEGYPVYSVHQHAMAPMALLDLAEAGGTSYDEPIRRGLHWMAAPPELAGLDLPIIKDDLAVTWRKVYRGDPYKAVRAVQSLTTRVAPGHRLNVLDQVVRPHSVDRECRPYEFGWMLYAWLGTLKPGAPADEPAEATTLEIESLDFSAYDFGGAQQPSSATHDFFGTREPVGAESDASASDYPASDYPAPDFSQPEAAQSEAVQSDTPEPEAEPEARETWQ